MTRTSGSRRCPARGTSRCWSATWWWRRATGRCCCWRPDLPTRYYLPREDVRLGLLEATDNVSVCPYKGDGGQLLELPGAARAGQRGVVVLRRRCRPSRRSRTGSPSTTSSSTCGSTASCSSGRSRRSAGPSSGRAGSDGSVPPRVVPVATDPAVLSVNVGAPAVLRGEAGRPPGSARCPSTRSTSRTRAASVAGRRGQGFSGVAGDFIGSGRHHGGADQAVYAFAREELDHWERELGRTLAPGLFGENLTTVGLDVDAAEQGDTWTVGTAVLRVSAPRVPCANFAFRMGERAWVRRFAERGRGGCYLAVERAGRIVPGDPIAVERSGSGLADPAAARRVDGRPRRGARGDGARRASTTRVVGTSPGCSPSAPEASAPSAVGTIRSDFRPSAPPLRPNYRALARGSP